ncbi:hypothetical protein [Pseudomonas amygdali]
MIRPTGERQQVRSKCGYRQCQSSQRSRIPRKTTRFNGNPASSKVSEDRLHEPRLHCSTAQKWLQSPEKRNTALPNDAIAINAGIRYRWRFRIPVLLVSLSIDLFPLQSKLKCSNHGTCDVSDNIRPHSISNTSIDTRRVKMKRLHWLLAGSCAALLAACSNPVPFGTPEDLARMKQDLNLAYLPSTVLPLKWAYFDYGVQQEGVDTVDTLALVQPGLLTLVGYENGHYVRQAEITSASTDCMYIFKGDVSAQPVWLLPLTEN